MNDKYEYNQHFDRRRMTELADILSMGYMRFRKRRSDKEYCAFPENFLDDVAPSARLRTTENRTIEKGASL